MTTPGTPLDSGSAGDALPAVASEPAGSTPPDTAPPAATPPEAAPPEAAAPAPPAATPSEAAPPPRDRHRRRKLAVLGILAVLVIGFGLLATTYLITRKPITELPMIQEIVREKLPHYAFSIYGAAKPIGVAVSPSGDRIYVTESEGEHLVVAYDGKGNRVGTLKPPASTGPNHVPVYLALDPVGGDVYVSDRPAGSIYVFDRDGTYVRTFEPKDRQFVGWQPLALAFDAGGLLYVTDVAPPYHRVLAFNRDGTLVRSIGRPGQFSFPNGVAIDDRRNVYVTDSNNGRLLVFDPNGKQIAVVNRGVGEGDLGLPRGAAIDDSGRLYVVDTANHIVQLYHVVTQKAARLTYIGAIGSEGRLDGNFEYPNGVAVDVRARVYVTDRENDRVQVWSY